MLQMDVAIGKRNGKFGQNGKLGQNLKLCSHGHLYLDEIRIDPVHM